MKTNFSFRTRQGMAVATAIAEEVENNTAYGRKLGLRRDCEIRPILLSIQGDTFRFKGGVVVRLHLVNLSQFDEHWRNSPEDWVVCSAVVRYYERGDSSCSNQKVEQVWGHEKLAALKKVRSWWRPHVRDITTIKGTVCVFWDNGASEGYTEVDPDRNQSGGFISIDEVPYARFVEGDLDRAKTEAIRRLDALMAK